MKRVVILISGRGSNMEAIVQAQIPGAQIAAVISNRPDAAGRSAVGVGQRAEELIANLRNTVQVEFQVVPRIRVGNHIPTQWV